MAREIVTSENREKYISKKMEQKNPSKKEEKNGLKEISEKYKKDNVESGLFDTRSGIELAKIIVPKEKRGTGVGSKFMSDLTAHADKEGKKIVLTPSKDFGASSTARLVDFYKKHGFVENKGKNKDFEISHSMYRHASKKD